MPGLIKTTQMGTGMGSTYGPCPMCDGVGRVFGDGAGTDDEADDPT